MRKFDGSSLSISNVTGGFDASAVTGFDASAVTGVTAVSDGASLLEIMEKRCLSFDSTIERSSANVTLRDLRLRFCS